MSVSSVITSVRRRVTEPHCVASDETMNVVGAHVSSTTHWRRMRCHQFRANTVRPKLSVLASTLGNLPSRSTKGSQGSSTPATKATTV
jgi:hypothetical protein